MPGTNLIIYNMVHLAVFTDNKYNSLFCMDCVGACCTNKRRLTIIIRCSIILSEHKGDIENVYNARYKTRDKPGRTSGMESLCLRLVININRIRLQDEL